MKKSKEKSGCCKKGNNGFISGIAYGLVPHAGCIAFIIFTILGVTTATAILRPLLLNPYFFYILIVLSFVFTSFSAIYYLKKNEILSKQGVKRKWKYILTLYSTTIGVNLVLFIIIFPLLANVSAKPTSITGNFIESTNNENPNSMSSIKLEVSIPCSGHAPLITDELKKIDGILGIEFSFPNIFDVTYDSSTTSKDEILSLSVFNTYKPTVLDYTEEDTNLSNSDVNSPDNSVDVGCGCGG